MTFGQAMVALEQGKFVHPVNWVDDYLFKRQQYFYNKNKEVIHINLQQYINDTWEEVVIWKYEETLLRKNVVALSCPWCKRVSYKLDDCKEIYSFCPKCGKRLEE